MLAELIAAATMALTPSQQRPIEQYLTVHETPTLSIDESWASERSMAETVWGHQLRKWRTVYNDLPQGHDGYFERSTGRLIAAAPHRGKWGRVVIVDEPEAYLRGEPTAITPSSLFQLMEPPIQRHPFDRLKDAVVIATDAADALSDFEGLIGNERRAALDERLEPLFGGKGSTTYNGPRTAWVDWDGPVGRRIHTLAEIAEFESGHSLLAAHNAQESGFDPNATSRDARSRPVAQGLAQLTVEINRAIPRIISKIRTELHKKGVEMPAVNYDPSDWLFQAAIGHAWHDVERLTLPVDNRSIIYQISRYHGGWYADLAMQDGSSIAAKSSLDLSAAERFMIGADHCYATKNCRGFREDSYAHPAIVIALSEVVEERLANSDKVPLHRRLLTGPTNLHSVAWQQGVLLDDLWELNDHLRGRSVGDAGDAVNLYVPLDVGIDDEWWRKESSELLAVRRAYAESGVSDNHSSAYRLERLAIDRAAAGDLPYAIASFIIADKLRAKQSAGVYTLFERRANDPGRQEAFWRSLR